MNNKLKQYLQLILIAICSITFVMILVNVLANEIIYFDSLVYNFVSKFIKEPVTSILKVITNLSGPVFLITVTFCVLLINKNRKFGECIVINLALVTVINQILKFIIQRPRPTRLQHLIAENGYSFPSGHSMVSMAFYGLLIYFAYTKTKNRKRRWTICILLAMLILAIGTSRIYLGVHYASDVVGGFALAIIYLYIFIKVFVSKMNLLQKEK